MQVNAENKDVRFEENGNKKIGIVDAYNRNKPNYKKLGKAPLM